MREWRLRAGLSQRQLSTKLVRPITYASKVESQVRRVDPTELAEWANACGVDGKEFLSAVGFRHT